MRALSARECVVYEEIVVDSDALRRHYTALLVRGTPHAVLPPAKFISAAIKRRVELANEEKMAYQVAMKWFM
jgi:hypothetical protein